MFVELHAVEVMHADACISPSEMSKCDVVVKFIEETIPSRSSPGWLLAFHTLVDSNSQRPGSSTKQGQHACTNKKIASTRPVAVGPRSVKKAGTSSIRKLPAVYPACEMIARSVWLVCSLRSKYPTREVRIVIRSEKISSSVSSTYCLV
jgi:hypothetical protein